MKREEECGYLNTGQQQNAKERQSDREKERDWQELVVEHIYL